MKTATGLTLIALGAVLAFAVNGHPWFLNLQVVGWILMVIGVIGLVVPRRGYGWLRRQVVPRRGPDGRPVMRTRRRYPRYTMIDPAAPAAAAYDTAEMPVVPGDTVFPGDTVVTEETVVPEDTVAPREPVVPPTEAVPETVVSDDPVVEEYYPE